MTYVLLLGLSLLAARGAAVENILGTLITGGSFYYNPEIDMTVVRDSNGIKKYSAKGKCRPIEHSGIGACDMKICNPINTFDEEKKYCKFPAGKSSCDHYCERRAWKYYHQPVPLEGSQRCDGNECYIEEGWVNATEIGTTLEESTTTTDGAGITGQVGGKGASFGGTVYIENSYTRGVGYTTTKGTSNTLNMGQSFKGEHDKFEGARCGRWKAVPVMIRTCGVVSGYRSPDKNKDPNDCSGLGPDAVPVLTSKETCVDMISAVPGDPNTYDIRIIPWYQSCDGGENDLPASEQSPAWKDLFYNQKGLDDPEGKKGCDFDPYEKQFEPEDWTGVPKGWCEQPNGSHRPCEETKSFDKTVHPSGQPVTPGTPGEQPATPETPVEQPVTPETPEKEPGSPETSEVVTTRLMRRGTRT